MASIVYLSASSKTNLGTDDAGRAWGEVREEKRVGQGKGGRSLSALYRC